MCRRADVLFYSAQAYIQTNWEENEQKYDSQIVRFWALLQNCLEVQILVCFLKPFIKNRFFVENSSYPFKAHFCLYFDSQLWSVSFLYIEWIWIYFILPLLYWLFIIVFAIFVWKSCLSELFLFFVNFFCNCIVWESNCHSASPMVTE